jgi:hypothetical protein
METPMKARLCTLAVLLSLSLRAFSQTQNPSSSPQTSNDIDPLALKVLKAATEPIREAKGFSFRALVSMEHLGSNGQIITLFHLSEITMLRPDKLRVSFHGRGKEVELFYNAGQSVLYSPEAKLYTTIPSYKTIDVTLNELQKKDVFIPVSNFLHSDPYQSLTKGLKSGYVIGKVMLFDQPVHHLAFTSADADWQLWVIGGDKPLVRRLEVVDKRTPEHPRVVVDFLDWDLNANPRNDLFTFQTPADAKEIELMKLSAED